MNSDISFSSGPLLISVTCSLSEVTVVLEVSDVKREHEHVINKKADKVTPAMILIILFMCHPPYKDIMDDGRRNINYLIR